MVSSVHGSENDARSIDAMAARTLYESAGFRAIGRRRGYYRRPVEDALLLMRERTSRRTHPESNDQPAALSPEAAG